MPASFSPAPNSMANLSLEAESGLGFSPQTGQASGGLEFGNSSAHCPLHQPIPCPSHRCRCQPP